MSPGKRLQQWRKNHNMKASVLALQIGVSQATISNFECGKSRISSEALANLHTVGVNIDWLLCGEGDMDCYSSKYLRHIIKIAEDLPESCLEQLHGYAEYLLYLEEKHKRKSCSNNRTNRQYN